MSRLKAAPSLETLTKLFEKICFVLLAPTHDTITLKHLKELEKIVAEKEKIYNIDVENGKENKPWDEEEKVDEDGLQPSPLLDDNCLKPSPFLTWAQGIQDEVTEISHTPNGTKVNLLQNTKLLEYIKKHVIPNLPLWSDSIIKPFKDHIDGLIGFHGAASINGACENRFMQLKHHILKNTPRSMHPKDLRDPRDLRDLRELWHPANPTDFQHPRRSTDIQNPTYVRHPYCCTRRLRQSKLNIMKETFSQFFYKMRICFMKSYFLA